MMHSSHNPFKFAFILNHSSVKTYHIQSSTWFLPELQSTAYIDFCLYEDGEGEQMFESKRSRKSRSLRLNQYVSGQETNCWR